MSEPDKDEVTKRGQQGFDMRPDHSLWAKASGTGALTNWTSLDWKAIYAAFWGAAAVPNGGDEAVQKEMKTIADPQTLRDAALALYEVQGNMLMVAQSIADQVEALAGENGVWKGPAAKAFRDMMIEFSRRVDKQARTISGNKLGEDNVPTQLWNNGEQLQWAQVELNRINYFYANEAQEAGAPTMDGNRVQVSAKPEVVAMMSQSMREVASTVSKLYKVTVDTVDAPYLGDLNQPPGGDDKNTRGQQTFDDPFKNWKPPTFDNPFGNWKPPTFSNKFDQPTIGDPFSKWKPPTIGNPFNDWTTPSVGNPFNDWKPPPVNQKTPLTDPPKYQGGNPPNGQQPGSGNPPPSTHVPKPPPFTNYPPYQNGQNRPPNSPPYGQNRPPSFPPYGQSRPPAGGQNRGPGGSQQRPPARFPGSNPPGGNDGHGRPDLTKPSTHGPVSHAIQPKDWATESGPGASGGTDQRGTGSPPMMPPMGGAGGNGSNESRGRSDASGLLGDQNDAWLGDKKPGIGNPSGHQTPVSTPEDWATAASNGGTPGTAMPPMMPPMSPSAAGNDSGSRRSDASGLLGDETDAWSGADPTIGAPNAVNAPPVDPEDWASAGDIAPDAVPTPAFPGSAMPELTLPGSVLPGPAFPGPAASKPTLPEPVLSGPTVPEPTLAGPTTPGPTVPGVVGAGRALPGSADDSTRRPERPQRVRSAVAPVEDVSGEQGVVLAAGQEVLIDRVAVVTPSSDDEDTAAWDAPAGAGLSGLFGSFVAGQARDGEDGARSGPDHVLRGTEPWDDGDGTERTTYRRQKGGEIVSDEWEPLWCSDAPLPEPEVEPEPEEAEPEERRTAANLLQQSDDAWLGGSGTKPTGILE